MVPFTKIEANGNDFILVENKKLEGFDLSKFSQIICNRHFGVGSDGIIIIDSSSKADVKMVFFNPDGTKDICGNGIRCVARYFYNKSPFNKLDIQIDTGIVTATAMDNGKLFSVAMLPPTKIENKKVHSKFGDIQGMLVMVGTPHFVIDETSIIREIKIHELGEELERSPEFEESMNIDLFRLISRDEVQIKIWERGVGETLSCGTAACATVIAASNKNLVNNPCKVISSGGTLHVEWDKKSSLSLKGPAEITFDGKFKYI